MTAINNDNLSRKQKTEGKDPVAKQLLIQKADNLTQKLGRKDSHTLYGWFSRWKKRKNICFAKLHEESASADFDVMDDCQSNINGPN